MARTTARVLALLEALQRGGVHPVAELAAELGVDERTVRRYAEQLLELDIPIVGVRGRNGGYRLEAGRRMPPLQLDDDEALAVLLGLTGLPGKDAAAAADKIRRMLPERTRRRLDALLQTGRVAGPVPRSDGAGNRILLLIAEAAHDRRPVWFEYVSRDGRDSGRTVHPFGLVARSGRWYVVGHDTASDEQRTFRLDRMRNPSLMPGTFESPVGFDARAAVAVSLASTPWRYEVAVCVETTADEVRARLPEGLSALVAVEPLGDGATRLRMRAERLDWIPGMLAGLGSPFVVESPVELLAEVRALAERLLAATRASAPPRE